MTGKKRRRLLSGIRKRLAMRTCFQKIGSNIEKLKANERIRIIADIFRGVNQEIRPINTSQFMRGAEKSLCCPDYFEFKKDYFLYNDKFARMVYLKHLPSSLVDDLLKELCETSLPIVTTVNIAPVEPSEAIKVVKRQLTAMRSNKMQKERKAAQNGVFTDVISDDLKQSLEEGEELLNDLQSKNHRSIIWRNRRFAKALRRLPMPQRWRRRLLKKLHKPLQRLPQALLQR